MVGQSSSNWLRRLLATASVAVLTALGLVAEPPSAAASPNADTVSATVAAEANWILRAQLPDGAIGIYPASATIWPDQANTAAAGLARATEVTGDPDYAQHAWSYLRWYSASEQPGTGYVTDYEVVGGTTPVSTGQFDSTDAYAGTFLAAVWDAYSATGDLATLQSISSGIAGAISAIASTQSQDGLTWAQPSWHVAYLMDNAQAYGGLVAASRLETVLGNTALASEASARALAMQDGIASLWDPETNAYDWARQDNGAQHATAWANLYPDAMEQVAAIEWDAVPALRAESLLQSFASAHPDWVSPTAEDSYLQGADVVSQPVGYWPMVASAYAVTGQQNTATTGVNDIISAAAQANDAWPFTPADAGDIIMALSGGPLDPAPAQPTLVRHDGTGGRSPLPVRGGGGVSGAPGSTGTARAVLDASVVASPLISATATTCRQRMPCTLLARGELRYALR